jgi:AraC-like DNA-binding protein
MSFTEHEIEAIIRINIFINSDYKRKICIVDLVFQYNISESALISGFKFLYRKSIYHYRFEKAMEYSKTLLDNGKQVKDVAKDVGYNSTGSFSRAYKKVFATAPGTPVDKFK